MDPPPCSIIHKHIMNNKVIVLSIEKEGVWMGIGLFNV